MYLLATAATVSLVYGTFRRIAAWCRGTGHITDRLDQPFTRLIFMLKCTLLQSQILRVPIPGIIHLALFWGFALFFLGTISIMVHENFGVPVYQGHFYLVLNLLMDVAAVTAIAGIIFATFRRILRRSRHLKTDPEDLFSLFLIGVVILSGLILEGARIARNPEPWSAWQPAGHLFSKWFSGMTAGALLDLHSGLWIMHLVAAMILIGSIPYLKLFHIVSGPAGIFFGDQKAAATLHPIDFEKEELSDLGVGKIEQFHWKHLLDMDTCMSCGRCQEECPAWEAGKPLSPMKINLDLRNSLRRVSRSVKPAVPEENVSTTLSGTPDNSLVGDMVDEESLWSCTTCRACEVHCPVMVEHVPRIVDMRRHQVMMESSFPEEALNVFRGLEDNFNPWNLDSSNRFDWAKDIEVPLIFDNVEAEYLLWTGCAAAFDQRNQKVLKRFVTILQNAGINFAVLGNEEQCCGDPARRLGNEFLYNSLARANVEILNHYKVRKIIATCPHCFNTLKNEYQQFDGHFEVIHHSIFIQSLIDDGYINAKADEHLPNDSIIGYHDPCYLGRFNSVFDEPRQLLRSAGIQQLTELERNREKSFCCGGGGGRMWLEDEPDQALNRVRSREILQGGINVMITACPYCLIMLTDGLKAEERSDIQVLDITEII